MGVLDGVRVLDLSRGSAGPLATMLLSDHGAEVIKIEPPGGDPFRGLAAYRVWNRGKKSVVLDLQDRSSRDLLVDLVRDADVLVESFAPGTMAKLELDWARLRAENPRLVYASITGYGRHAELKDRPAYDA